MTKNNKARMTLKSRKSSKMVLTPSCTNTGTQLFAIASSSRDPKPCADVFWGRRRIQTACYVPIPFEHDFKYIVFEGLQCGGAGAMFPCRVQQKVGNRLKCAHGSKTEFRLSWIPITVRCPCCAPGVADGKPIDSG